MKNKINIDSDLGLLSDAFTMEAPSLDYWTKKTVKVMAGYEGKEITAIDGIVDTWTLNITPKEVTLNLKGRDYMKLGIVNVFNKTYFYKSPDVPPTNRYGVPIPYSVGRGIMASTVALDACTFAGLKLSWECPDYTIVNAIEPTKGFNASVSAVLRELIAPLDVTELFKIDISCEGDTVFIRKRQYPYKADFAYDITQLKVGGIALDQIDNDRTIRDIYVSQDIPIPGTPEAIDKAADEAEKQGGDKGGGNTGGTGGGGSTVLLDVTTVDVKETFLNDSPFQSENMVLTREITSTTKFGDLVRKKTKQVFTRLFSKDGDPFDLELTEDSIQLFNYLEPVQSSGFNKLLSKNTKTTVYEQGPDRATYVYKSRVIQEDTTYVYTYANEAVVEDTVKHVKLYDTDGSNLLIDPKTGKPVISVERETVEHEKLTADMNQTTNTKTKDGVFVSQEKVTTSGQLPGPKAVGPVINHADTLDKHKDNTPGGGGSTAPDDAEHFDKGLWWRRIHVNDTGEDVEIESNLLSRDLLYQLAQEKKLEALLTKYQLSMKTLPAVWMKKGHALKINAVLPDGIGGTTDLSAFTFLITKVNLNADDRSFTASMEAVAWL